MKAKYLLIGLTALIIFFSGIVEARTVRADFHYFYHSLRHHGTWIETTNGDIVWKPAVSFASWSPYSHGSWIWTDWGWYWDSSEPFGFIVYHYGRWYYDVYYGWVWTPGYDWAPAWVEWRYDDDYIGWAPLHPFAVFDFGIGIVVRTTYIVHHTHWVFVGHKHFSDPYVYNYYVPSQYRYRIYQGSASRFDYTYDGTRIINRGVDVKIIERKSNTKIRVREIAFNERGTKNEINHNRDRIEISYNRNLIDEKRDRTTYRFDKGERDLSTSLRDVSPRKKDDVRKEDVNKIRENTRNSARDDRNEKYKDERTNNEDKYSPTYRDDSLKNDERTNIRKDERNESRNNNNSRNVTRDDNKNENRSGNVTRDDSKKEVRNTTYENPKRENENRTEVKRENQSRSRDESPKRKDR